MRHAIDRADKSAVLYLIVGSYKVRLLGDDLVRVECLKDDGSWLESQFPPWRWIIPALEELAGKSEPG